MTDHSYRVGLYLCYMIACALHGAKAECSPEGITWVELFALAKQQRVEGISFMGLPDGISSMDGNLFHRWAEAADITLYKELTYAEESNAIEQALQGEGLGTMVLKGPDICACYPRPGMRSMSDIDILYGFIESDSKATSFHVAGDTENARRITMHKASMVARNAMTKHGYEQYDLVGYIKKPFHIELHQWIMEPDNRLFAYYANPWDTAQPVENTSLKFRQSMEDAYIFHIAHCYKHYVNYGCGIKFLIDEYVLCKRLETSQGNWRYISRELNQMDLAGFEEELNKLSKSVFDSRRLIDDNELVGSELLRHMLRNGAYGTQRHWQNVQIDKRSTLQYLQWRLWPGWGWVEGRHPFVARHRWLVSFLLLLRFFQGVFLKPKRRLKELRDFVARKFWSKG